jgi:hypothetical protein
MDSIIIIVLAIILLALIILNNIKIDKTDNTTNRTAHCSQTTFGCCPNGVDSKINYYGANCPGYKPGPSLPSKKPIGGCAGTRYGCCPDNNTPKFDQSGSNCLIH